MADDETKNTHQLATVPDYLEFGPAQISIFASVSPVTEAFAQQHGMALSRNFDRDPLRPCACYFLMLKLMLKGRGFIRVCAADPFVDQSRFQSHFVIDLILSLMVCRRAAKAGEGTIPLTRGRTSSRPFWKRPK